MYRILSASKDTYITNKIVKNSFRVTDANVGKAGTLDLFKLYNENTISGESNPIELSRLLLKFPIQEITSMDADKTLDISDSSFKCYVKLFDVYGGQTTPSKFTVILMPLSQSFDEGSGMDIVSFSDLDTANFVTASHSNGSPVSWNLQGANASGSLGDENIDVIVSGTLDANTGPISLSPFQYFDNGDEDLVIDVTTIISGTVAGLIPDYGFCLALSGAFETNDKTYFVKRFSSKDSIIPSKRPQLVVKFDDSTRDNHQDFIFNVTSSLYLQNYHRDSLSNMLSGSSATELTGNNCLVVKIESGSYKKTVNVSQAKRGRHSLAGVYSASFAIDSYNTTLYKEANLTGSITFNEVWTNSNETITYLSSSLVVKKENRQIANTKNQDNVGIIFMI